MKGEQVKQLQQALLSAFPDIDSLRALTLTQLDEKLEKITLAKSLAATTLDLIEWAMARSRLEELVAKAHLENPGNAELRRFAEKWKRVPEVSAVGEAQVLRAAEQEDILSHNEFSSPQKFPPGSCVQIVQESDFRMHRLREWVELERHFRNLINSFELFHNTIRRSRNRWDEEKKTELTEQWNMFDTYWLPELKSFVAAAEYIHKPLYEEKPSAFDGKVDIWIASLVQKGSQIQNAIENDGAGELYQHGREFQSLLQGYMTDYRSLLKSEILQLCELTVLLRSKVNASGDEPHE